jgi:hypothetical protein
VARIGIAYTQLRRYAYVDCLRMPDLSPELAVRLERSRKAAIREKRKGVLLIRRPLRFGEEPCSFIGGLPRLPEDLDWPLSPRTDLPFNFIAQIDFRDVPRPRGVSFPRRGTIWFFADFSSERFRGQHTAVLFDARSGIAAPERDAPDGLPPLHPGGDGFGWLASQHPRAFVEPKAALSMHLFDTFYDFPYDVDDEFDPQSDFGPGTYMTMIRELREDALRRAIGVDRSQGGYWYTAGSRYGEKRWPATSIDAEYALMSLLFEIGGYAYGKDVPKKVVNHLSARLQDEIRALRALEPRELAPAERRAIKALTDEVRDRTRQQDMNIRFAVEHTHPHAAFEIMTRMPDAGRYLPAQLLDPYQELTFAGPLYLHQMFGHGSAAQNAALSAEEDGYVPLLQLGGNAYLGFPLMHDAVMHYWIPRQDLTAGRFDRVEGTWEAG